MYNQEDLLNNIQLERFVKERFQLVDCPFLQNISGSLSCKVIYIISDKLYSDIRCLKFLQQA